jgi:hypothetical protein
VGGDRAAELEQARHRRILIRPIAERPRRDLADGKRPVFIGKALPQIDRAMLGSERGHHSEDRGAERAEHRIWIAPRHLA